MMSLQNCLWIVAVCLALNGLMYGAGPPQAPTVTIPQESPVTHNVMYGPVDVEPSMAPKDSRRVLMSMGHVTPDSYDLRSHQCVTPVKNQGGAPSCWIFSTYASLESSILVAGGAVSDLSENHMKNYHGFDGGLRGGNCFMSQAYLGRWDGPVSEIYDPYHDYDDRPSPGGPPRFFVREMLELDTDSELKECLITHGAISTSMYSNSTYYNEAPCTYYYDGPAPANHAVTIVGWDDDKIVPGAPAPGAWLIKNSWGTDWGDGGYFWLSYNDSRGANDGFCFCDIVGPNTYQKVYYHDDFGNVGTFSFSYAFNAFTTPSEQMLTAVQFWTQADGAGYDIRIYEAFNGTSLTGLLGSTTGTCALAGAHTVDLPTPVHLAEGDDFYIYLHITDGGSFPLAADWAIEGHSSLCMAGPGESYFSDDGAHWTDLIAIKPTANFCIRGLITTTAPPEITVLGNEVSISDGDITSDLGDGTFFDNIAQGETASSRTFTVRNDGTGTLGLDTVTVPTGFTLTKVLPTHLAPGESDTFSLDLDTSEVGTKDGLIIIRNDDSDEHLFNFAVNGVVLGPEITIGGNRWLIVDGDATPWLTDHTDFGVVGQGGTPIDRTFLVRNDGNTDLTLGAVTVPAGFTVTEDLTTHLSAGATDTFTVQLNTAMVGTKTGDISFWNDDLDEAPFNFSVTGIVTDEAEVTVLGREVWIADGDTTPSPDDDTNIGSAVLGGPTNSREFTVRNDGALPLALGSVTVPEGFTLAEDLSPSLLPGDSDTFTVELETTTTGIKPGEVSFTTNDSDENPFNFEITGRVTSFEEPVAFPDLALKMAIEDTLGVMDPTPTDMLSLTELYAWGMGLGLPVQNLEGLQYATNLTHLGLWGQPISDISLLSELTKLTSLHLGHNQFNNISPLAGLTNLTELWLGSLDLTDISALAGLTNLTFLDLSFNEQITNISALAELTNLTYLNLGWASVTDISTLARMTELTYLDLVDSHISDISALAGLTNLTDLRLYHNLFSDIQPLAGLAKLTYLDIGDCQVSDISRLAGLTNLTHLNLGVTNITDISALAGMTNLAHLELRGNKINDIMPLSGLTKLTYLDLANNQINDSSALASLTNLTYLNLNGSQAFDISPLASLANLTHLELGGNWIKDITPLAGLRKLTNLNIGLNQIDDISVLSGLTNLTELNIDEIQINDISALAGLTSLTKLRFEDTGITDITPIANLVNLTNLNARSNYISDISPLSRATGLAYLDLKANPLNDEAYTTYIPLIYANNPGITLRYDRLSRVVTDPQLEAAIEQTQGVMNPTAADMLRLTDLDASGMEIQDLEGLQYATNLVSLKLGGNQITDISALAGLTNLTYLDLTSSGQITDISALAGMTSLTHLGLGGANITDISTLARMTELTHLDLVGSHISDISPLAGMGNLTYLGLGWNDVTEISVLVGMTKLTYLDLVNCQVSDISMLRGLTDLTYLNLGHTNITDISALAGMTKLTYLDLMGNQISDISPLAELKNLTHLFTMGTQISDIAALAGLVNLAKLDLGGNHVTSIAELSGLVDLTELSLSGNQISDITALTGLVNLAKLNLDGNQISSIAELSGLVNLTELRISSNYITDISPLSGATGLLLLDLQANLLNDEAYATYIPLIIANNPGITLSYDLSPRVVFADPHLEAAIENALGINDPTPADMLGLTELQAQDRSIQDLEGLQYASNLAWLDLHGNTFSDLSPLAELTSLTHLYLGWTDVADISALAGLTDLVELELQKNEITDISALAGLTQLTHLDLYRTKVTDISALSGLTKLTRLELVSVKVSNILALSGLTKLTHLDLAFSKVSNISALSGLTKLTHLDLTNSKVSEISALSGLTKLTHLDLMNSEVSDISPLINATDLVYLNLAGNPLNDEAHATYIPLILANNPGIEFDLVGKKPK